MAIVRTARRLRQEAAAEATGLTPTSTAALATIERHGPLTPSELAELERVKRPTVTRTLGCLEREGLIERTPDPADGRSALVSVNAAGRERLRRLRGRKNAYLARRMRDLPGRRRRDAGAGGGDPRADAGRMTAAGRSAVRPPAPLLQLARGPQLPALLRRPADLAVGHLDADGGGDLADPQPDRQRCRGRPDHGAAVPADAAVRRLGRAARRPDPETAAADRPPRR